LYTQLDPIKRIELDSVKNDDFEDHLREICGWLSIEYIPSSLRSKKTFFAETFLKETDEIDLRHADFVQLMNIMDSCADKVEKGDWQAAKERTELFLLLAGYSINDTVVVFDRIRENRRKYKRMSLIDMINLSTNQIATRTTLVSAATALSVIPLLFGGPVLYNFSVAILFGIVVGTFSSTYVAAMLLLYMPSVSGGNVESKTEEATA